MYSDERYLRDVLHACYRVIASCDRCAESVPVGGRRNMYKDCADLATIVVRLLDRGSPVAKEALALCAKVCRLCAEAQPYGDPDAAECAKICREASQVFLHQEHKPEPPRLH